MPVFRANCSWVKFACSRNLRTNRPRIVFASISPLVDTDFLLACLSPIVEIAGMYRIEQADCFEWLRGCPEQSLEAVCTDPPYGILEFTEKELAKMRAGRGGVWRLPPKVGGSHRDP